MRLQRAFQAGKLSRGVRDEPSEARARRADRPPGRDASRGPADLRIQT